MNARVKRWAGTSWLMRPLGKWPNGSVQVTADGRVHVSYAVGAGRSQVIVLSRRDARLLARRINEFLDSTGKR